MEERRGEREIKDMWTEEERQYRHERSKEKDAIEKKCKAFLLFSAHDRGDYPPSDHIIQALLEWVALRSYWKYLY